MLDNIIKDIIKDINNPKLDINERNTLYQRVKSILDHTDWFTLDYRNLVKNAAMESNHFTRKQKKSFNTTPPNSSAGDRYDDHENGCPDGIDEDCWDNLMEGRD